MPPAKYIIPPTIFPAIFPAILLISACATAPDSASSNTTSTNPTPASTTRPPMRTSPALVAENLVLTEWGKAENKASCAPASFLKTGQPMNARRADFSGGWAVAFDLPGLRSAYGIAGTGSLDSDNISEAARRGEIERWPYVRDLPALPAPSYAGYGLSGFNDYPTDNRAGAGLDNAAYMRIGGQKCLYNVWSKISRAHLESLLDNIRLIETPE